MIGIVVTTGEHKGVFFGYVEEMPNLDISKTVALKQGRMCVYWSENVRGVVGLAVTGPLDGCKISPAAPELFPADVNLIMKCTSEAIAEWEKGRWS